MVLTAVCQTLFSKNTRNGWLKSNTDSLLITKNAILPV
jgi:hypothetical protein